MARTRWIGILAAAILTGAACTVPPAPPSPPTPAIAPGPAPPAVSQPPTPAATASPGRVARQVYTAFRTVPSPCCPPRPLPEILDRLRQFPGILEARLEEGRLVVEYDPKVRSAEDLPVLLALHGLEVNP